jgi:curved DNA-binding protein CbpA
MAAYSKYFEKIRIRRDRRADAETDAPRCQWDGCTEAGTHRAPVGRMREGEYFRFCLEHVRHYNKGFNYFSGIADSEIARFQKEALTGHRPTWRIGSNGGSVYASDFARLRSGTAGHYNRLRDPFGVFGGAAREDRAETPRRRKLRSLEARAMETLGLTETATGAEIKSRYKELVKRHHPDANGGNRESEDRFRDVIQAYRLLKQAGLC